MRTERAERELKLVDAVITGLVDPWSLARGSDEESREEIRQRRMIVPVRDETAQQVGPAEKRAVGGRRAAEHEMIAAAGSDVTAVDHELLAGETGLVRGVVE